MKKIQIKMFDVGGFKRTAIIEGFSVEEVTETIEKAIQEGDRVIVDTEGTIFNLRNIVQISAPKYLEKGDE